MKVLFNRYSFLSDFPSNTHRREVHNISESFSQTVVTACRAGRLYILPGKTFEGCSRWDHCFWTSFTTRGRDQIVKGIFFNQVLIKIFFSHENLHVKTSGIFVNQSIKRIKIIDYHSIKLKKYSKNECWQF